MTWRNATDQIFLPHNMSSTWQIHRLTTCQFCKAPGFYFFPFIFCLLTLLARCCRVPTSKDLRNSLARCCTVPTDLLHSLKGAAQHPQTYYIPLKDAVLHSTHRLSIFPWKVLHSTHRPTPFPSKVPWNRVTPSLGIKSVMLSETALLNCNESTFCIK